MALTLVRRCLPALLIPLACQAAAADPVDIGSRRELFVDYHLIDTLSDVQLRLNPPREEGAVLSFELPHEGPFSAYTTVIRDGDRFRMYYRGISKLTRDGSEHERTCYSESDDGIHWTKPSLGFYDFNGSKQNNIVLADVAPITHNLSPLLDTNPDAPAAERYKAIGGTEGGLHAFVSADGLRWKRMQEEPFLVSADIPIPHRHLFDSQNLAFWSPAEDCYVCYFRIWDGIRRIARTTSKDFRSWTPAVLMRQLHDDGGGPVPAPEEHLYTNQTSPYFRAPHIYVATAARFFPGRQVVSDEQAALLNVNPKYYKDSSDSVFMTSRGGDVYDRTFLEGFLKPGIGLSNWVSRANYPALNIVQTGPAEMSFYVNHEYAQPSAHLKRYSLRLDGFASVHAGARDGELLTKPLVFDGKKLSINFATSAAGSVRVEIQEADGTPIPGYTLADSVDVIGNEIERHVRWKSGDSVSALADRPVRLRFILRDADLFALQFQQ